MKHTPSHRAPARSAVRRPLAVAAVLGVVSAVVLPAAALGATPAVADSGKVEVVNTETVQAYLDATGRQQVARIYEQLTLTGSGSTTVDNPVAGSTRNLDGFGGSDVEDDVQVVRTDVDGEERFRSVTPYTEKLPLDVDVTYTLDGEEVQPGDVVGRTGRLQVQFHVVNRTAQPQQVEVEDGRGGTVSRMVDVAIPMVGSLTTVAPASFRNVSSEQANVAGDGKGGTKLSFTMTLFAPVGAPESTFGYSADIEDGVVPRVDISALPVDPLASPTFASAAESYQGGADTGARLADGASTIDTNLLKLRDGSQDLLAGLIQLRDGAGQLNEGLEAKAVPGSKKLADGTGTLVAGLAKLADGGDRLAAGTGRLTGGTAKAAAGGKKLNAGLKKISGGLGKLKDVEGLPAVADGIDLLKGGVDRIVAEGIGSPTTPDTLLNGATRLKVGADRLKAGADALVSGVEASAGKPAAAKAGLATALDEVVKGEGSIREIAAALGSIAAQCQTLPDPAAVQTCRTSVGTASGKIAPALTSTGTAKAYLNGVSAGLTDSEKSVVELLAGAKQLQGGLVEVQGGSGLLVGGLNTLQAKLGEVRGGLDKLDVGLTKAIDGVLQLSTGADTAYAGSSELSSGLGDLDAGAAKLDAGAAKLSDGASKAADGSVRLDDGAQQLADGLGDAGEGSGKLADGLSTAAEKAPALPKGAQRLSTEGTTKLVEAGETTATEYAEKVAVMKAGAERAHSEGMAVGAPEGAVGRTAYSYVLQGEDGEGRRNTVRAAGGAAAVAAAGGLLWWRRRGLL